MFINRISLNKKFTQNVMNIFFRLFCCVSVVISSQKYLSKVHILQIKKNCLIESWFFFRIRERYTYYESKKGTCHRTTCTFYSIFNIVHVESLKYKMICIKITKIKWICYFLYKQWSKILNYVYVVTTV